MFHSFTSIAALILAVGPQVSHGAQGSSAASRTVRFDAADHIALARVIETRSEMGRNRFGDDVIMTRVRFEVQKTLKGTLAGRSEIVIEGGTLGGVTFEVSHAPKIRKGDEVVVSMDDGPEGIVPHPFNYGIQRVVKSAREEHERAKYFALMKAKWKQSPVLYYVNPNNADADSRDTLAAIQRAAETWNTSSRASFKFRYAGLTSATGASKNGKNEILFRNEVAPTGQLTTATTYSWWDSEGNLLDSDLVFWDGAFLFHAGSMGCTEGAYIQNVATHELGHVLGLKHSDVPESTMAPTAPACDQTAQTLSLDDIAGIEALYPPL